MTTKNHAPLAASSDGTHPVDLARPDAAAEKLAETLKTVQMNTLFSRLVLFSIKWFIRPLFVWPFKLFMLAVAGYAQAPQSSHADQINDRLHRQRQRGDI